MADDTSTIDVSAVAEATAANKTYTGSIKATDRAFSHLSDRTLPKVARSLKEIQNQLGSKYFEVMAEGATKMQKSMSTAFDGAMKSGDVFSIRLASSLKGLSVNFADTTKKALLIRDSIKDLSKTYANQSTQLLKVNSLQVKATERLEKNKDAYEKLRIEWEKSGRKNKDLETQMGSMEQTLLLQTGVVKKLTTEVHNLQSGIYQTTEAVEAHVAELKKQEEAMANQYSDMLREKMAMHETRAKQDVMTGGYKSITSSAKLAVLQTGKFREGLETIAKGGAFLIALGLIKDALVGYASYTQASRAASLQMGDATDRTGKQITEAHVAMANATQIAGEFGESVENVNNITSKFRLGVVLDKNGQLGEKALSNLTRETLFFSKATGIDASQASAMLEKRIRNTGMSAEEAVGDMQDMQLALTQMAAANKNNNVPLKEMVEIVDEARDSTNSYIVDNRLLTQSLRSAATQASAMGAATKQASDVAKSMGKVFSKAPDYIKLPAGFDLADKLMGGDADAFLAKYDDKTKAQMKGLQQQLKAGTITRFSAGKILMDLVGGEEDAMQATLKRMEGTLKGPAAVELIAQQYGIENMATANIVTEQLRNLSSMQKKYQGIRIGTVMAMVAQEAEFKQMMTEVGSKKEQLEKLKQKGFTDKSANEYIKQWDAVDAKQKEIEKDRMNGGKNEEKLQRDLANLMVQKAETAEGAMNPVKNVMHELNKMNLVKDGKPFKVESKFANLKDLKDAGAKFSTVADALELQGDQRKAAEKMWNDDANSRNISDLADQKRVQSENLDKQKKLLTDFSAKMASGPIDAIYQTFQKWFPWLSTPLGKLTLGMGTLAIVFMGVGKILRGMITRVETPIYRGTLRALKETGGHPQLPSGSDTGSPSGEPSGGKWKPKKLGREQLKTGWSQLRTKGSRFRGAANILGSGLRGIWNVGRSSAHDVFGGAAAAETVAENIHPGQKSLGLIEKGAPSLVSAASKTGRFAGLMSKFSAIGESVKGSGMVSSLWKKIVGFAPALKSFGGKMGGSAAIGALFSIPEAYEILTSDMSTKDKTRMLGRIATVLAAQTAALAATAGLTGGAGLVAGVAVSSGAGIGAGAAYDAMFGTGTDKSGMPTATDAAGSTMSTPVTTGTPVGGGGGGGVAAANTRPSGAGVAGLDELKSKEGTIQGDGSLKLTIPNFMSIFAQGSKSLASNKSYA